jgi:hypothetical protein
MIIEALFQLCCSGGGQPWVVLAEQGLGRGKRWCENPEVGLSRMKRPEVECGEVQWMVSTAWGWG